jgi:hypothetical protein
MTFKKSTVFDFKSKFKLSWIHSDLFNFSARHKYDNWRLLKELNKIKLNRREL